LPDIDFIKDLLQQASAQGSRSTALNPLQWALAIVLSALLGATKVQAPAWVFRMLATSAVVILLAYLAAYFFLLVKDRDALRSEKYKLSKMANRVCGHRKQGRLALDGTELGKTGIDGNMGSWEIWGLTGRSRPVVLQVPQRSVRPT